MTARISVFGGSAALADDEDYWRLMLYLWSPFKGRHTIYPRCNTQPFLMHSFILGPRTGLTVDHVNGDGLDNRRSNLRYATNQQNVVNQAKVPGRGKSKYKGVRLKRRGRKKYISAEIGHNYQRIHLGYFSTEEEAAEAYDRKAVELFGEFTATNFPEDG